MQADGKHVEPITAVPYEHLPKGRAPKRLVPVRDKLKSDGHLAIQDVTLKNGREQKRTVNLRDPNLDIFSAKEIALVDQVIGALWELDAEEASEFSHNFVGWKMTKLHDPIPYGTIFISDAPLTEAEILRGQQIARELGLTA